MAQKNSGNFAAQVRFAGPKADEKPPEVAVYQIDGTGRAIKKLAQVEKGQLEVKAEWSKIGNRGARPRRRRHQHAHDRSPRPLSPRCRRPRSGASAASRFAEICGWGFCRKRSASAAPAKKCRPWWWDLLERGRRRSTASRPVTVDHAEAARGPVGASPLASVALRPAVRWHCRNLRASVLLYSYSSSRHFRSAARHSRSRPDSDPRPDPVPWPGPDPWPGPTPWTNLVNRDRRACEPWTSRYVASRRRRPRSPRCTRPSCAAPQAHRGHAARLRSHAERAPLPRLRRSRAHEFGRRAAIRRGTAVPLRPRVLLQLAQSG